MKILYESDLAGSKNHGMAYRIYQFSKEFGESGHEGESMCEKKFDR